MEEDKKVIENNKEVCLVGLEDVDINDDIIIEQPISEEDTQDLTQLLSNTQELDLGDING